ncbi:MAG: hypothetical protein KDK09_03270 [Rhodobacteraceae bacterium]|nr:hypothetical protein [Paracoccaceae bacterium]
MSLTSAAWVCSAATMSRSVEVWVTTIPASVIAISVVIAPGRAKKMSSVGLWITICGSRPSATRWIIPATWRVSASITAGSAARVSVRMPLGRSTTPRVKVW